MAIVLQANKPPSASAAIKLILFILDCPLLMFLFVRLPPGCRSADWLFTTGKPDAAQGNRLQKVASLLVKMAAKSQAAAGGQVFLENF
jgi:hypothetical protein